MNVVVNLKLNDLTYTDWLSSEMEIALYQNGIATSFNYENGIKTNSSITWENVPAGTYDIYAAEANSAPEDIVDTGIDIIVGESSTATATIDYYELVLDYNEMMSLVIGSGIYLKDTNANINAGVKSGYIWKNWTYTQSGEVYSIEKETTIEMDNTYSLTANGARIIKGKYNEISYKGIPRLPITYQEVEYIESTGTQYIDTGKKYNTLNDKFEIDIGVYYAQAPADNEYIFGTPTSTGRYLSPRIDKDKETITAVTGGNNASLWVKDVNLPTGQKNDLKFIVNNKNLILTVNGVSSSSGTSSTPSSTGTISLFDLGGSNNPFNGRIYYFTLLNQNNVKVIDLVPCYRKADNVAGMFDLVSNVFYTNSGTGEFEVGNDVEYDIEIVRFKEISYKGSSKLPSEYQELEYIESSGTQYIDTGIKNTTGDSYEMEFMPLKVNDTQRYFGGLATSTGIGLGLRNDGNLMTFAGGWIYPSGVKPTINQKIKVEYRSGYGWYLDDTLIDSDTSTTTESQNNILLCSVMYNRQAYYPSSIKLYSYKHKNSDNVLVRDLVPCYRKADNVIGMYDIVNDVFYTNAGTGSFTKGRNVDLLTPQKYGIIE